VVSSLSYAKKLQSTVTDSVFRVVRTSSGTLTESHEIQAVNGTPAKGEHVGGPTSLSGVFTGGLDAVSLRQRACMSYTLQPIGPWTSERTLCHSIHYHAQHSTAFWLCSEGRGGRSSIR
jgi:hypothetical protein